MILSFFWISPILFLLTFCQQDSTWFFLVTLYKDLTYSDSSSLTLAWKFSKCKIWIWQAADNYLQL